MFFSTARFSLICAVEKRCSLSRETILSGAPRFLEEKEKKKKRRKINLTLEKKKEKEIKEKKNYTCRAYTRKAFNLN